MLLYFKIFFCLFILMMVVKAPAYFTPVNACENFTCAELCRDAAAWYSAANSGWLWGGQVLTILCWNGSDISHVIQIQTNFGIWSPLLFHLQITLSVCRMLYKIKLGGLRCSKL
jgi:hypothetical protein